MCTSSVTPREHKLDNARAAHIVHNERVWLCSPSNKSVTMPCLVPLTVQLQSTSRGTSTLSVVPTVWCATHCSAPQQTGQARQCRLQPGPTHRRPNSLLVGLVNNRGPLLQTMKCGTLHTTPSKLDLNRPPLNNWFGCVVLNSKQNAGTSL